MIEALLLSETSPAAAMKAGVAYGSPRRSESGAVRPTVDADGLAALFGAQLLALTGLEVATRDPEPWPGPGLGGSAEKSQQHGVEVEPETAAPGAVALVAADELEATVPGGSSRTVELVRVQHWTPAVSSSEPTTAFAAAVKDDEVSQRALVAEILDLHTQTTSQDETASQQDMPSRRGPDAGAQPSAAAIGVEPAASSGGPEATVFQAPEVKAVGGGPDAETVENSQPVKMSRPRGSEAASSGPKDRSRTRSVGDRTSEGGLQASRITNAGSGWGRSEETTAPSSGEDVQEKNDRGSAATIVEPKSSGENIKSRDVGGADDQPAPRRLVPTRPQSSNQPRFAAKEPLPAQGLSAGVETWTEKLRAAEPAQDESPRSDQGVKRSSSTTFPQAGAKPNVGATGPAVSPEAPVQTSGFRQPQTLPLDSETATAPTTSADTRGDSDSPPEDRRPPARRLLEQSGSAKAAPLKFDDLERAGDMQRTQGLQGAGGAERAVKPATDDQANWGEDVARGEGQNAANPSPQSGRGAEMGLARRVLSAEPAPAPPSSPASPSSSSMAAGLASAPILRSADTQSAPPLVPQVAASEPTQAAVQVAASEIRRSGESTQLTVRIEDDRLGSLALRIAEKSGGVDVVLRTDNALAAKQFQSNLPQLYESLFQRGLQPDARAWSPAANADADRRQQEQQHRERDSRQQGRDRRGRDAKDTTTFALPIS